MAEDVLSQSEIDKLLSALSDGSVDANQVKAEEDQKKVKVYDFKRPDKFSKDQIRTLQMLHDNFGRLLNTYLSTSLRSMVDVEVASVEQLTYQEFVQSLANPSVIGVLAVPPLKGNIVMELNTSIAFSIIDRVFGGTGANTVKPRSLTEIEEYTFFLCDSLRTITIPEGVRSIGEGAFLDCSSLKKVSLPRSLRSIGEKAFYGQIHLTAHNVLESTVPETLTVP